MTQLGPSACLRFQPKGDVRRVGGPDPYCPMADLIRRGRERVFLTQGGNSMPEHDRHEPAGWRLHLVANTSSDNRCLNWVWPSTLSILKVTVGAGLASQSISTRPKFSCA